MDPRHPEIQRISHTGPFGECLARTPVRSVGYRERGIVVPPPSRSWEGDEPGGITAPIADVATPTVKSGDPTAIGIGVATAVASRRSMPPSEPSPTPSPRTSIVPTPSAPLRILPPVSLAPARSFEAPIAAAVVPLRGLSAVFEHFLSGLWARIARLWMRIR